MKEFYLVSADNNSHSDGLLTNKKILENYTIERVKKAFGVGTEVIFRTGSLETSIEKSESSNPMVVFFGHNRGISNLNNALNKIGAQKISLFNISCYAKEGIEEALKNAEISSEAFSTSGEDTTSLNGYSNVVTALFGRRFKSIQDSQISKASIADWVLSCSHERSGVMPQNNNPNYFIKTSKETICIDAVSYLQRYAETKGVLQLEDERILREVYRPIVEKWTSLHSDIEQLFMRKLFPQYGIDGKSYISGMNPSGKYLEQYIGIEVDACLQGSQSIKDTVEILTSKFNNAFGVNVSVESLFEQPVRFRSVGQSVSSMTELDSLETPNRQHLIDRALDAKIDQVNAALVDPRNFTADGKKKCFDAAVTFMATNPLFLEKLNVHAPSIDIKQRAFASNAAIAMPYNSQYEKTKDWLIKLQNEDILQPDHLFSDRRDGSPIWKLPYPVRTALLEFENHRSNRVLLELKKDDVNKALMSSLYDVDLKIFSEKSKIQNIKRIQRQIVSGDYVLFESPIERFAEKGIEEVLRQDKPSEIIAPVLAAGRYCRHEIERCNNEIERFYSRKAQADYSFNQADSHLKTCFRHRFKDGDKSYKAFLDHVNQHGSQASLEALLENPKKFGETKFKPLSAMGNKDVPLSWANTFHTASNMLRYQKEAQEYKNIVQDYSEYRQKIASESGVIFSILGVLPKSALQKAEKLVENYEVRNIDDLQYVAGNISKSRINLFIQGDENNQTKIRNFEEPEVQFVPSSIDALLQMREVELAR